MKIYGASKIRELTKFSTIVRSSRLHRISGNDWLASYSNRLQLLKFNSYGCFPYFCLKFSQYLYLMYIRICVTDVWSIATYFWQVLISIKRKYLSYPKTNAEMRIKLTITLFNDSAIIKPDLVWLPVNLIWNSFNFLVHQKNYLSPLTHRVEIQNQARISKLHCTLTISLEQLDLRVQRGIAVSKSKLCKKKKKYIYMPTFASKIATESIILLKMTLWYLS